MSAISVILLAIIFCIIQISLLKKGNRKWMKYLPTAIGGIGVVVGIAIYYISYILFGKYIFDVISHSNIISTLSGNIL